MRSVILIARREFTSFFDRHLAFPIIAALLAAEGIMFQSLAMGDRQALSSAVLSFFFYITFGFTCAAGILLSMGTLSNETRQGTIVNLYTAPISEWHIVLGKWLGAFAFVLLFVALTGYMPLMIAVNGTVNPGHVMAGYLGLVLLASAVTAIGTFASSLNKYQLVGGVIGALIVGFLVVMWWVARKTDPPFSDIFGYLSMYQKHFEDLATGTIHSRDVVYYLSLTFSFLLGTRVVLGARRWR